MKVITYEDCVQLYEDFKKYAETAEQHKFPVLFMIDFKIVRTLKEWEGKSNIDQKEARAMFRVVYRFIGKDSSEFNESKGEGNMENKVTAIPKYTNVELNEVVFVRKPLCVKAIKVEKEFILSNSDGEVKADIGDMVIIEPDGKQHICKADVFENEYRRKVIYNKNPKNEELTMFVNKTNNITGLKDIFEEVFDRIRDSLDHCENKEGLSHKFEIAIEADKIYFNKKINAK